MQNIFQKTNKITQKQESANSSKSARVGVSAGIGDVLGGESSPSETTRVNNASTPGNYSSDPTRTHVCSMLSRVPEIEVSEVETERIEKHGGEEDCPVALTRNAGMFKNCLHRVWMRDVDTPSGSATWTDHHLKSQ